MNSKTYPLDTDWIVEHVDFDHGMRNRAYAGDYQPQSGLPATVPTTARQVLLAHKRIPDPYQATKSEKSKWVEQKEWWFFRDFTTPRHGKEQRVYLEFCGITYRAEMWVNGIQVGMIEGMFRKDTFDITDCLHAGANRIAVRVRTQENAHLDDNGMPLAATVRPQGPVIQCLYYWNWVQHMVAVGIWQPVNLVVKGPVSFSRVDTRTISVATKGEDGFSAPRADAVVQLEWSVCNDSPHAREVSIDYAIGGETFSKKDILKNRITKRVPAAGTVTVRARHTIPDAHLWWCNGLGTPHLHTLSTTLMENGWAHDHRTIVFGIRTIRFVHNTNEKKVIARSGHSNRPWSNVGRMYPWTFVLNRRKVFVKGSNWVPVDALLRLDRQRYETQLRPARAAHLNFLRVWGGGIAETDDFYDLCNRFGIMCWQEFWLACGNYPAMKHDLFVRCVKDTVQRLANNPSLVFYSGGNEFEPDNIENKGLIDAVAAAVKQNDPTREFRRGSPYKGDKHGGLVKTPMMTRNKYLDVLPGESRNVLFRSEIAVGRSMPMFSSLDRFLPKEKRWPVDSAFRRHFFAVPFESNSFAAEYDSLDSFRHYVMANYLSHSEIVRYNLEYCRSRMFGCTGCLNWQLNVPWPAMHRALVDTWGVPKPAYYYYKKAAEPLIANLDFERYLFDPNEVFDAACWIVNDGKARHGLTVTTRLYSTQSELLHEKSVATDAPENASRKLFTLDFIVPLSLSHKVFFAQVSIEDTHGTVYDNWYTVAVSNNPRPSLCISLDGQWRRADGDAVRLPGNDMAMEHTSINDLMGVSDATDLETLTETKKRVVSRKTTVTYTRRLVLPQSARGKRLEFFCAGFEASDEVHINGTRIGGHEFKLARFCGKTLNYTSFSGGKAGDRYRKDSEYGFAGDPITLPKLEPRFYSIPGHILRFGTENEIQITLKHRYAKACSCSLFIREATSAGMRKAVAGYMRRGAFYAALRAMPPAELSVTPTKNSVVVKNVSKHIAFFVLTEIIPDTTGISLPLDKNALTLLPGQSATLRIDTGKPFHSPSTVTVQGWNISPVKMHD